MRNETQLYGDLICVISIPANAVGVSHIPQREIIASHFLSESPELLPQPLPIRFVQTHATYILYLVSDAFPPARSLGIRKNLIFQNYTLQFPIPGGCPRILDVQFFSSRHHHHHTNATDNSCVFAFLISLFSVTSTSIFRESPAWCHYLTVEISIYILFNTRSKYSSNKIHMRARILTFERIYIFSPIPRICESWYSTALIYQEERFGFAADYNDRSVLDDFIPRGTVDDFHCLVVFWDAKDPVDTDKVCC